MFSLKWTENKKMSHQNLHNTFDNFPEWALFMYEKAFEMMDRNRILPIK
jgi:hypothetical protein